MVQGHEKTLRTEEKLKEKRKKEKHLQMAKSLESKKIDIKPINSKS